jgi:hypothetical protein
MDLRAHKEHLREHGLYVAPGILSESETDAVRTGLWRAAGENERREVPTRNIDLRVFN